VKVRLVSGDHFECCKRTAIHAGIVSHDQADEEGVCLTGEEFMASVGTWSQEWSAAQRRKYFKIDDLDQFIKVIAPLRVLARATPEVKELLLAGIN
jgi:magnesium-transporting ATPase (P-type)